MKDMIAIPLHYVCGNGNSVSCQRQSGWAGGRWEAGPVWQIDNQSHLLACLSRQSNLIRAFGNISKDVQWCCYLLAVLVVDVCGYPLQI